ncbi:MAG: hypothetical protein ABI461_07365, partial [Polyangiaceae bacterium]
MRCPKCGYTFLVKLEGGAAVVHPIKPGAAPPAPAPAAIAAQAVAQAAVTAPELPSSPSSAPPERISTAPEADDPFADLPSPAKPDSAGLPAIKTNAASTATRPARPSPLTKGAPPRIPPRPAPSLDDLPAIGPKFAKPAALQVPPALRKPEPSRPLSDLGDLDADLPAPAKKSALPATVPAKGVQRFAPRPPPPKLPLTPSLELEMDLPAKPAAIKQADLPAIATRSAQGSLPKAPPVPTKKAAAVFEPDPAFGEIDLPAVGASLPAMSASLPAIAASLPAISASLPQVAAAL